MFTKLFRDLKQDLRSSELVWLFIALALSVTALSSVSFLADRMQRAFQFDARQLLAADLLVVGDKPLPEIFIQEASRRQLQIAQTIVFPSMATVGPQSKLSSLKAASSAYPLRGNLEVRSNLKSYDDAPPPGSVWVEASMLNALNAQVGQNMSLGNKKFLIGGVLDKELDKGAGFMNFAPRVMMSLDDLPSTGLIGLGSRVTYRLLLAGSDKAIGDYRQWIVDQIESQSLRGLRIETLENAQPIMRKTLDRAERFLSLIALLTAMVAAVAIALSSRRYVFKQTEVCAVMKCLGASQNNILMKQLTTLFVLGLMASFVGAIFGYLTQELLLRLLGNVLMADIPSVTAWPVLWSILFSWFLLLGFAAPPLLSLATVSPIRLVRKELDGFSIKAVWVALFGSIACAALIVLAARDLKLAGIVGLSFITAVLIFACLAWLALWLLSHLRPKSFALRFALNMQSRRAGFVVIQVTALGIALMALLLIMLLRQDLLATWQGNIPPESPNRFMINIQADQKQAVSQSLLKAGASVPTFYPMIRGRLIDINERIIVPDDFAEERARRLVDREFNLSYTSELPGDNRITAGRWIIGDESQISLEEGIAKTLNLKLGDRMTFEVAGEKITAPVTSLRKLDWSSMRVNFFVIMPPAQLNAMPQSWITSYFQSPSIRGLDFELTQLFPNITIVNVAQSLQQIQEVLDRLASALGLLFTFTIAAAILVLLAAISATQDERYRNAALLKAVGASRQTLAKISGSELLLIGVLSGLLGGVGAAGAAWALGRFALEIEFNAFAQSVAMGIGFGVLACALASYRFDRKIQQATAIDCLREA